MCLAATILYAVAMIGRNAREIPSVTRTLTALAVTMLAITIFALLSLELAIVFACTGAWLLFVILRDRERRVNNARLAREHCGAFAKAVGEVQIATLTVASTLEGGRDRAERAMRRAARHADAVAGVAPVRERAAWANIGPCIREADLATASDLLVSLGLRDMAHVFKRLRYLDGIYSSVGKKCSP